MPPLSQFSRIVSQSYTFLYVPKKFLYVPAGNLEEGLQELYVPIRSYYVPYTFLRVIFLFFSEVIRSYTFLRNCVDNSPDPPNGPFVLPGLPGDAHIYPEK